MIMVLFYLWIIDHKLKNRKLSKHNRLHKIIIFSKINNIFKNWDKKLLSFLNIK